MVALHPYAFLTHDGAIAKRMHAIDWSRSPLGSPEHWPPVVKSTLATWLDSPQAMCMVWGPDLRFFYNEAYAPFLAGREDGAIGRPMRELWSDIWSDIEPIVRTALRGEGSRHEDLMLVMQGAGAVRNTWWTFTYMPLRDEQGQVVGMLCTTEETTDRVLAGRHARSEQERQRLMLQQMPGFVAVMSGPQHVFDYVNDAYRQLAGPREFLGRTVREVFPELEGQGLFELLDQAYRSGAPYREHARPIRLAGDEQRYIDFLYFPMRDEAGRVIGIFAGGYDATEQIKAQASLHRLNETLEQRVLERTEDLARAQDALRQAQKMEAVGQLTGGLAHDFNNLLAGIQGNLQILQLRLQQGQTEGLERYVGAGQSAVRRAATLTQRLLAFSRRQALDPQPIDVNRLVAGLEEMVRRTVGPQVEVEVVGAAGLWTARLDASQLENSLLNLCINARDAMAPGGGRLTVETANKSLDAHAARERDLPPGQYVSVCVTDTGSGMGPEVIERAVDPFFTTKPLGAGTGLGLSMVYGFVRQSGGQLRIYSELGSGTTMCMYFPRHRGPADAAAEVAAPEMHTGSGETILVIDDEQSIRDFIVEVLQDHGYTALHAADGAAGLRILQSDAQVDLLITDVGLPGGLNGRQVVDRGRLARPGLKVLFITGFAENALVGNGALERGMELLSKPFDIMDLSEKVRALLDR